MNVLLLALAFSAWSGSARAVFLRLMAAIAVFSIEMQLATVWNVATIRSMRLLNVLAAAVGILWIASQRARARRVETRDGGQDTAVQVPRQTGIASVPPLPAVATVALLVSTLAIALPVRGADPYHLHRVDQITSRGTLAYDPTAPDIKVNALAGVYELLLADMRIPGMSTALVRLHGVFGLALYLLSIAVVAPWFRLRRRWLLVTFLVVPVVFHQLVLVKNDLFGALPAFVALTWVVTRGRKLSLREGLAAAALAGFAVGIKISTTPLALVVLAFIAFDHRDNWRTVMAAVLGTAAGAVAGGLLFTLIQNQLVYGGPMQPYTSLGNRHEQVGDAAIGVARFAISLVDLGTLSPRLWPGRGGWGSTFGLPLVWALVVLMWRWREPLARRALVAAAACFLMFAASYPDADIAHRMVIAPGLLLVAAALACVDGDDRWATWMRGALVPVLIVSALQISRSAWLYFAGTGL